MRAILAEMELMKCSKLQSNREITLFVHGTLVGLMHVAQDCTACMFHIAIFVAVDSVTALGIQSMSHLTDPNRLELGGMQFATDVPQTLT